MTGLELKALIDRAIPGVRRDVIKKAIDTKTGIVVLGKKRQAEKNQL